MVIPTGIRLLMIAIEELNNKYIVWREREKSYTYRNKAADDCIDELNNQSILQRERKKL